MAKRISSSSEHVADEVALIKIESFINAIVGGETKAACKDTGTMEVRY